MMVEFREGQTATNPKTQQKLIYQGGLWVEHKPEGASKVMNPAYADAFAKRRAAADVATIEKAGEGVQTSDSLIATSGQARQLLNEGVPTGSFADVRLGVGRAIGNKATSALTGGLIPDKPQVAKMERFQQLTNEAVLGDVGKLKGPLSDRDIQFLKDTQAGIKTSPEGNRRALAAREWAATRLSAYESALQSWTQKLGAPSALNPRGQSFNAWFSGWANQNIPPPTGETYSYQSKAKGSDNALTGQSGGKNALTSSTPKPLATGQGWKVLSED